MKIKHNKKHFTRNLQAISAREVSRLTADLHLSLQFSKSNSLKSHSHLCRSPAPPPPSPVKHIDLPIVMSLPLLIALSRPLSPEGISQDSTSHPSQGGKQVNYKLQLSLCSPKSYPSVIPSSASYHLLKHPLPLCPHLQWSTDLPSPNFFCSTHCLSHTQL